MKLCHAKRIIKIGAIFFLSLGLSSCFGINNIDQSNGEQLFNQFSSGTLRLGTGFKRIHNNAHFADELFKAAQNQDWAELAKVAIQSNAGDDIGYYYLGMAAEGLGYKKAAATYYTMSIQVINDRSMPSKCVHSQDQGMYLDRSYYSSVCRGIVLPNDAIARLNRLR